MAETPAQTWQRLTGTNWSASRQHGSGSASANLALQQRLLTGWRPGQSTPAQSSSPADTYSDFVTRTTREREGLLGQQKAEQEGLFKTYEQKIAGQEKLPDVYRRLQTEAGIPELRGTLGTFKEEAARVKGLIDRLGEDVNARSEGQFTTEAQRRRIEAAEGGKLSTELGRVTEGMRPVVDLLGQAGAEVATLLGVTNEQQAKELQPTIMRIEATSDRFAREMTGFDQNRELELGNILDKLQRQRDLDDREWQKAAQLAAEERAFAREKKLLAEQFAGQQKAALDLQRSSAEASKQEELMGIRGLGASEAARRFKQQGLSQNDTLRMLREAGFKFGPELTQQLSGIY